MTYYNNSIYRNYQEPEYKINIKMSEDFRGKASISSLSSE